MSPQIGRLAVVGLGLLGGSVALAARERGVAREIRAVDPHVKEPLEIPLVSPGEAAAWADLIVVAVPGGQVAGVLSALAPRLRETTLLTDVVGVKRPMAELAQRLLPDPGQMVGAHPMAGSHHSGWDAARADLFQDAPCFVTPTGTEAPAVVDRIEEFWQCLGAVTVRRTPEEHDAISAVLSHAPHLIAYAFARGLPDDEVLGFAGPGLRDFVRIARGNSQLWCDILLMNHDRVSEEVARFKADLDELLAALERGDAEALEAALDQACRRSERLGQVPTAKR